MKTEEEKLKKKLKVNTIAIVILLVILLIILCIVLVKIFSVQNGVANNDSNMGLAAQSDDLKFYYDYNKGLVKKDKDSEKIVTKDQTYSVNYFDGRIYYTTPNSAGGINIKSINLDGKDEKVLLSTTSSSTKMYLQNSKIYYLTSNPDTISKIDLSGKNEEIILQRSVIDFKVIDETIYFSDIMGYLYSTDLNGENYKVLVEESLFNKFQILDEYVYYYDTENSQLMRINLKKSSEKEVVTDKLDCDIYNVTTNGIYYFNKAKSQLAYVSLDGKKSKDIVKLNTNNTKINVIGNIIFYIDNEGEKTITKSIKTNGKQID